MIDKLGGILTKGLLGNGPSSMILGRFNLSLFGIEIIVTPVVSAGASGIRYPFPSRDDEQPDDQYLTFKIRLKEQEFVKTYRLSKTNVTILLKLNESIKNILRKTDVFVTDFLVKPVKKMIKFNIHGSFK
jgi:hypothetical protein